MTQQTDLTQYTIIQLIEKIVTHTANCKLDEKAMAESMPYAEALSLRLSLAPMQCVFLAVFMDNYWDTSIRIRELTEHFGCTRIKIMCYDDELKALVKSQYIKKRRDRETGSYKLPQEVVDALLANKAYVAPTTSGLNSEGLFECFARYFKEFDRRESTTDDLTEKIEGVMSENADLHFVRAINKCFEYKQDNDDYARLILVYLCHLLVNCDERMFDSDDMSDVLDSERESIRITKSFKKGKHILVTQEYVEVRTKEGLFSRDLFVLTPKTIDDILKDFDLELDEENSATKKGILRHSTIALKKMFYNDAESKQIAQLSSLLEDENFRNVQQRLAENGMRKGFAALFYGAPGTGKTESVLQIAKATGRDIIEVNVSNIKSKWVGESEKNIKGTFDKYRKMCEKSERVPILLFNEADAVLSVRGKAEGAVDKMENSIQNIILQEMETLEGIMIATTNLTKNLDSAFERRFLYKIEFHKPSITAKQSIWQSMLPILSEEDAVSLAVRYDFSGGQIENIVRKHTVDMIINGENPTLDTINTYCQNENIHGSENRKRIGF